MSLVTCVELIGLVAPSGGRRFHGEDDQYSSKPGTGSVFTDIPIDPNDPPLATRFVQPSMLNRIWASPLYFIAASQVTG